MKKYFYILIFFFHTSLSFSNNNIVYLDVQFIIDNSNLGLFYKEKIIKIQNDNKNELELKEKAIKKKENEFNDQKNILNKQEVQKKLDELNLLAKDYQKLRNRLNKNIISEKKKYSKNILSILNPLLTNYVESKKINIVVEKKNVLVGIKSLDITTDILNILNEETKNLNKFDDN